MLQEFKDFIMRGNVLEFAVAVIMAGAFGAVINAFVNDIIMPPIGLALGGTNFSELIIALDDSGYSSRTLAMENGAPYIGWGIFVQMIINFVIISFVLFLLLRAYNSAIASEEDAPPEPTAEETLLGEIRDLLAKR